MLTVLASTWPLLLGVLLLMVGNGLQASVLGIRGAIEGFSTTEISIVTSAYFAGFLIGSRVVPLLIRRVGHVRVFAALGSVIAAVMVLYPTLPDWMVWTALRVLIGFSFSGVYISAESWLNNTATNQTRGRALSAYMIVQMLGIIGSQALLNLADPAGFTLFVIPAVLVSLSFVPMLLTVTPTPKFAETRRLSARALFRASPLGVVGMLLTGGIFSAMFGMASVWGTLNGFTVPEISVFIASLYVGGLLLQYPIGWASDRMDRRRLILWLAQVAAVVMAATVALAPPLAGMIVVALLLGGITNPVYALLIAQTNDSLSKEDMPAASAGLLAMNGAGAICGPLVTGWMMEAAGPRGFFLFIGLLYAGLAAYAAWQLRRPAAVRPAGCAEPEPASGADRAPDRLDAAE